MNKKEYSKLLKDWRWKERRSEILKRDNYTCQRCYASRYDGVLLNVHHKYYIDDRMPWDYPDDALITLCDDCHKIEHEENDIEIY